jgi:hypothetical protein
LGRLVKLLMLVESLSSFCGALLSFKYLMVD